VPVILALEECSSVGVPPFGVKLRNEDDCGFIAREEMDAFKSSSRISSSKALAVASRRLAARISSMGDN
jgi:hypothetical protein